MPASPEEHLKDHKVKIEYYGLVMLAYQVVMCYGLGQFILSFLA